MMDATQILADRIQHEIDIDLFREISKVVKVSLEKEIELAERKFNTKLHRAVNNITDKSVHETNTNC
jgi:hypothetical protein